MLQLLEHDVGFLRDHGLIDYSLLVGIHFKQKGVTQDYGTNHIPARDGANEVYYIGVIDFLIKYHMKKKMEGNIRGKVVNMRNKNKDMQFSALSVTHPDEYSARMMHFITSKTPNPAMLGGRRRSSAIGVPNFATSQSSPTAGGMPQPGGRRRAAVNMGDLASVAEAAAAAFASGSSSPEPPLGGRNASESSTGAASGASAGLGSIAEDQSHDGEGNDSSDMTIISPRGSAHAGKYRVLDLCVARESREMSSARTLELKKGEVITVTESYVTDDDVTRLRFQGTRQGSLRFEDSACSPVFEGADERARGPAGKKKGGGEGPKLSEVEVEPEVDGSGSVVMFVQPKFTADEAAGRVRCSVIRIGATDCRATVKFSTCDGSAGGGDDYVAVENEELVFAPGQTTAEAEVTIVGNDRWEEVETFVVRLSQPRGTRLGPLSEATVSVADDDEYPTGEHSEGWALLRGFIIEQVAQRGKKFWQTVCALVYIGLFPTIDALILKLVIDNSLKSARATQGGSGSGVDVDADNTAGHNTVAIVLGAVYMLCLGLYHKCDVVQLDKRGRSGTRKWLRNVLVVRFLNMSETGRRGLSDGDFLNCVYFQVEQLVCDGWYSFLLFFQFGTQIVSGMVFQVLLLALTTQVPFWPLLLGLLVVSALVGFTLAYRQMTQLELERIRGEAAASLVTPQRHLCPRGCTENCSGFSR